MRGLFPRGSTRASWASLFTGAFSVKLDTAVNGKYADVSIRCRVKNWLAFITSWNENFHWKKNVCIQDIKYSCRQYVLRVDEVLHLVRSSTHQCWTKLSTSSTPNKDCRQLYYSNTKVINFYLITHFSDHMIVIGFFQLTLLCNLSSFYNAHIYVFHS